MLCSVMSCGEWINEADLILVARSPFSIELLYSSDCILTLVLHPIVLDFSPLQRLPYRV